MSWNLLENDKDYLFSTDVKFSAKTNISYLLISTRTCAYEWVRNVISPENFAYVVNGWSQNKSLGTSLETAMRRKTLKMRLKILKIRNSFVKILKHFGRAGSYF